MVITETFRSKKVLNMLHIQNDTCDKVQNGCHIYIFSNLNTFAQLALIFKLVTDTILDMKLFNNLTWIDRIVSILTLKTICH